VNALAGRQGRLGRGGDDEVSITRPVLRPRRTMSGCPSHSQRRNLLARLQEAMVRGQMAE
jgi:hypothetical protein